MPSTTSPSTSPKPFTVAIIGGGIAGLSLTVGLLHHNIPVTLYEAAPAFAEIGAGVSFGPNALRAMALIDPAIREGYDRLATSNAWESKRGVWFDFRWGVDERVKGGNKGGKKAGDKISDVRADPTGQSSVHRAHFLDALVSLVPEGVAQFGKRIETVEDTPSGVLLTFADGTTAEHTTVIGCDGVKSRMRPILLGKDAPASTPTFTGKYAYRGLIPMDKAVELLGDELARNAQMYFGYDGHVLTFPIEKGATMNVVAFQTQHSGTWDSPEWVVPVKRAEMLQDFEGWGDSVRDIVSLMQKTDVWALFDHRPAETYYRGGKVCILGDAAHASTPHQGAGAGMALEDSFVLSGLLGSVKDAGEIESAFRAYDAVRRPRTQKLVTTSRAAAGVYEFQDGDIGDDEGKIGEHLKERYRWIWDEDLEQQLEIAKASMGIKAHLA
jgi:salicylate hydroxylase